MEFKSEWALNPLRLIMYHTHKEEIDNFKYQTWNEDIIIRFRYNSVTKTLILTEEILMEPEFPWQLDNLLSRIGADLECLVLTGIWRRGCINNTIEAALKSVNKHCCYGRLRHLKIGHDWNRNIIDSTSVFQKMQNNTLFCDGLRSIIFERITIQDVKIFSNFIKACRNLNYLGLGRTEFFINYENCDINSFHLPITENSSVKFIDFSYVFSNINYYMNTENVYKKYDEFLRNVPKLEYMKSTNLTNTNLLIGAFIRTKEKKRLKTFNIYRNISTKLEWGLNQKKENEIKLMTDSLLVDSDIDNLCNRIINHWTPNIDEPIDVNYRFIKKMLANEKPYKIHNFIKTVYEKWKVFGYDGWVNNLWCTTLLATTINDIELCQYLNEMFDRKISSRLDCLLKCITIMLYAIPTLSHTNSYTKETFNRLLTKIKDNKKETIDRFVYMHIKECVLLKIFFDTGINVNNNADKTIINKMFSKYFNELYFTLVEKK